MKTSGANSAQMYQQWLIKSSFGGWKVSAIDYLTFIDTYFRNPRGIGRLRFTKPKDYNYGLGALYRKTNTGYHYWHSGSFRWQSRAHNVSYGAFFAVLANGFSVVANFNRDGGDGRQGSLDDALYNALYGF